MPNPRQMPDALDVRPDRLDLRDRPYKPPLVSLPPEYPDPEIGYQVLPLYEPLILNQGNEGACTGFGLAAMINFLRWSRQWRQLALLGFDFEPQRLGTEDSVSPRMLYHLARFYDEWPGEDYDGSSCRGALKGWHKHGVCTENFWSYNNARFVPPSPGWQNNAAECTIGAYYRIDSGSVSDMQSAIYETGAIYVSAGVHDGWNNPSARNGVPVIKRPAGSIETGGHAFALVGYSRDGFLVQNSWGTGWGFHGFAIMPYEDWVENGMDAWVAALGVPAQTKTSTGVTVTKEELAGTVFRSRAFGIAAQSKPSGSAKTTPVSPWDDERAYHHMLVMGNNGTPINRLVSQENARSAVRHVCLERVVDEVKKHKFKHIAIYAHGGLNEEDAALKRTQIMAPYFYENGIYPIFIAWRTGLEETIGQILLDAFPGISDMFGPAEKAGGLWDDIKGVAEKLGEKMSQAKDSRIELACEKLAKPIWTQMKQNAGLAVKNGGGLQLLASDIKKALKSSTLRQSGTKVHLVGHSAGSILLGHLLDKFSSHSIKSASCTLYAAACTVDFASDHYAKAVTNKTLPGNRIHFDLLSDHNERNDNVAKIYGNSLLYLVSRALEDRHKMPLVGMEREWNIDATELEKLFGKAGAKEIDTWRKFVNKHNIQPAVYQRTSAKITRDGDTIPIAHGSFDNDIDVVEATLRRILQGNLKRSIHSLKGF